MRSQPALKYGLTEDQIEQLLADQNGVCLVCKDAPATCVDHCHSTGEVRGMLCHGCNRGLGLLGDDAAVLRSAIAYLGRPRPTIPPSAVSRGHDCESWCPGYTALRQMHIVNGQPIFEIAEALDVAPGEMLAAMIAHNVPRRGKEHVCGVRNVCPGKQALQQLYPAKSLDELGEHLGVSDTAARRLLAVHGIDRQRAGRPTGKWTRVDGKVVLREFIP